MALKDQSLSDIITTQSSQQITKDLDVRVPKFAYVSTPDGSATAWTQAAHRLFTVTGLAYVRVIGVVTETITGAATIEVGVAGATATIIAQLANASTLAANDIFGGRTTATAVPAVKMEDYTAVYNTDIDVLIGSANVTNGAITFYCEYIPINGATVEAAVWD